MQFPDDLNPAGRQPMTEKAMQIELIKSRVAAHEYAVDERAVADAIVALLLRRQNECS